MQGKKTEMLASIAAHPQETEFFLKTKPSRSLLAALLSQTKCQRLAVTAGIRKTLSARVVAALEKTGVRLETKPVKNGRPYRIPEATINHARKLLAARKSVPEIAEQLGIPARTLYYRLRLRADSRA